MGPPRAIAGTAGSPVDQTRRDDNPGEIAHGQSARSPQHALTPEGKSVYDKITAKRGQMRGGPYASLMHHPALAEKVGDLGEFLRFSSTLPGDIREMAILITARSVNQAYEWVAHARVARTEKLPDDIIERIRSRGDLSTLPPGYARPARVVQHVLAYESIPT